MAKQRDQGDEERRWTEVPNDGFDALMRSDLTLAQQKIAFLVSRFTHGFGRAEAELRHGFIAERTGLSRRTVQNGFAAKGRLFREGWLVKRKIKGKASALAWGPRLTQPDYSPGEGSSTSQPLPRQGEGTTPLVEAPYKRKQETKTERKAIAASPSPEMTEQVKVLLPLLLRFPGYKAKSKDAERLAWMIADFPDLDLAAELALAADWCCANPKRAWKDPLLGMRRRPDGWLLRSRAKQPVQGQAAKPAINHAEIAQQKKEGADFLQRMNPQ